MKRIILLSVIILSSSSSFSQTTETSSGVIEFNMSKKGTEQKNSTHENLIPSDVDIDIPVTDVVRTNTYALIFGNEDYSSFQSGLSSEANVNYAIHDAEIFREYCIKTLGIPEKQIKFYKNATSGQMIQGISWINNLASIDEGNAELIFYYAGHGLPDEVTKDPYLIPVDISGINVSLGIKLSDAYRKLTEYPAKRIIVFLDACFTGGARNQGLISARGVKIKPNEDNISGNMVVFTSSSGNESSGSFVEKQHGYFTYFLLKKLKESKGKITYSELADYIQKSVLKETGLTSKTQTPQVLISPEITKIWSSWEIR
jgi:hypothetical protein